MPISFMADSWKRGLRAAPLKYPEQLTRTFWRLLRDRPRIVFVQSPPSVAVWAVAAYAALRGASFIVDAHSDAFQRGRWIRPRWLNRMVARRAAATLVTDHYWADILHRWGAKAIVIPDVPTAYSAAATPPERIDQKVVTVAFVNTWADDEPLDALVAAARRLPHVVFKVTGRTDGHESAMRDAPDNVHFVGYLPDPAYYALLGQASAVMCLTTRDHTMQRGACEALSLGRPVITSDWPLLRGYFTHGTLYVDNTAGGIQRAVTKLIEDYDRLVQEIAALRDRRRSEWNERKEALRRLVAGKTA